MRPRSDFAAVSMSRFCRDGLSLKLEGCMMSVVFLCQQQQILASNIIFSSSSISSAGMSPVMNALTATETLSGSVEARSMVSKCARRKYEPVQDLMHDSASYDFRLMYRLPKDIRAGSIRTWYSGGGDLVDQGATVHVVGR